MTTLRRIMFSKNTTKERGGVGDETYYERVDRFAKEEYKNM